MELGFDLNHNIRFKDSVGKYVKVKTVDSCEIEGWLKCIDPMSGNFFLITFDDSFTSVLSTVLIMGDGCSSLEVLKESDEKIKGLLGILSDNESESLEDISDRKNRLIAWIKKNRLPIFENEDQSLIVGGNVTVSPPYDIQSCSSLNARTLTSIRQLIATMPSVVE